ncbi:type II toxin-antitoxin system RelE/ParE family toxin [Sphingomonas sp.]|uniref:type II toxin-antitoxin system RelE/ParE family toxin n=1 Tax=Sphingomonas sp. TaxID=28214 RepID=UPI00345BF3E2
MNPYTVSDEANARIDEILDYTHARWGKRQAGIYLDGLIARFEAIAARGLPWRPIPAWLGVEGYYCRYERHFIYWRAMGAARLAL